MNLSVVVTLLGLVLCGLCKPAIHNNFTFPLCDSPEAEAAAQVALDFINAQHTHGYKYTLNQIEDIKVINKVDGTHTYLLELELLETKCHAYNPKPVAQCDVRQKVETAVEADCDVALSETGGQFSVVAFKCKTELESVGPCGGCIFLEPLNFTRGVELVQNSLEKYNNNTTITATFSLLDIGRLSSQIVGGGALIRAEYAIIETNCTSVEVDNCVPLKAADADNVTLPVLPAGPGSPSTSQGFKNHKLTALHDPNATGLLSESNESAEKAPIVKRTAVDAQANAVLSTEPVVLHPRCPGKIIHF
ncbi:Alpha-2-HS-glycoprotein [Bagarius yarrelli]|uniref:Alpha-2-HS-glycoprotein n=1 Tax=Bagarius yarrelli TaxID=175774 RepID=A0A556TZW6_BAGYA|nr:Alpha-2-HS-glycoprotein [Bagarius yarrelli]